MSTYFFAGGTFPSADLFLYFQNHLTIERTWHINGRSQSAKVTIGINYSKTCENWLELLLKNEKAMKKDLRHTYGDQADMWFNRWIVFYLVSLHMSKTDLLELFGTVCV